MHTEPTGALAPDRLREAEAYDLDRVRRAQFIGLDCPTTRLLAVGAAAVGAEVVLVRSDHPGSCTARYLIPHARPGAEPTTASFVRETLRPWFPDVRAETVSTPTAGLADLLDGVRRHEDQPQLLVLPADPGSLLAVCDLLAEGVVQPDGPVALRLVAASGGGCCIVNPGPEDYEAQVATLLDMQGPGGADEVHADAAMIAAGTLLHELRLLAGARAGLAQGDMPEVFPMAPVCALRLPPPRAEPLPGEGAICVGAGGIGSALCLFGLSATPDMADPLMLMDGDVVEPHNLLLHRHAGEWKVIALKEELLRLSGPRRIAALPEMVSEDTRMPSGHNLLFAVTDSALSRLLAQEALFRDGRHGVMVSGGSTVTGAEAYVVGGPGRGACIRCRLPTAETEASAAACSRRPASFAGNLTAAGLALALARRRGDREFLLSHDGIARHTCTSHAPGRFSIFLAQRCGHLDRGGDGLDGWQGSE